MPLIIKRKVNDLYHFYIFQYLKPYFIQAKDNIKSNSYTKNGNSDIIWIFWWQGKSNMPRLVHSCIKSVIERNPSHKVVILSRDNIFLYVNFSKSIYDKIYNKTISLAHFSDILRFRLLYKYGGLWIDSTIYCASSLNNTYFTSVYTSNGNKNINKTHVFVSSKWTEFLIGGNKGNLLFSFMNEFYKSYLANNKRFIDYFLSDYALCYAYENNIGHFRSYVDKDACYNNPHLYSLVNLLNEPFNAKKYKLITSDTNLFKLTYKKKFNNDIGTFYNKIVTDSLS